ncbi:MAG: DUF5777 family beta-barrel protein [Blastocatellia bacterium]
MQSNRIVKLFLISALLAVCASQLRAFPDYLKLYAADPSSRPDLRSRCSTCHLNSQGGGERNAFGKAFEAAGNKITDELRRQFPDYFVPTVPVTFVQGSDSQAVVEINGKKLLIDTRTHTVSEVAENRPVEKAAPREVKTTAAQAEETGAYQQMDVRLISLPTAKPIPKNSLWTDFTHRFPFGEYDVTDAAGLFGLDGFAVPAFGLIYGITDRIHAGFYRSSAVTGAPIQLYLGASLLDENRRHPFTAMARIGVEGRDNFQRNFTTSLELTLARSITSKAQLYVVPTLSLNNRPFGSPVQNLPGENTFALGLGTAINIRPTVALMAEANMRVNEKGRFGSTRPAFGFGIEKVSVSRRHAFSLVFSNGAGTTMSQRSATRASLIGPFASESFEGLTIGFNLSRRLF